MSKSNASKWLRVGLSVLLLAALAFAAWKYLDFREIMHAIDAFKWAYAGPILALSALHLYLKALRFVVLLRPLTRLPPGLVTRAYIAGQPATFVPGGIAARAALLAQCGVRPGAASGPILYSSLTDQIVFILAALVASLWYPAGRPVALSAFAVLGLVALLMAFRGPRDLVTRLLRALASRIGQVEHWDHFVAALESIHNFGTISLALLISAAAYVVVIYIFQLCLLGVGAHVPFLSVLLCYTVPSMAGRLTVLPGGVGVTEGGMIGMLAALAGVDRNAGAAAATLLRIGDSLFQGFLGIVVFLFFWRGRREQQHVEVVIEAS